MLYPLSYEGIASVLLGLSRSLNRYLISSGWEAGFHRSSPGLQSDSVVIQRSWRYLKRATTNTTSRNAMPNLYHRIILKISGESFAPRGERGIDMEEVLDIASQTYRAAQQGVQIGIVIGGGNILRGGQFTAGNAGIQEATAHYMGMIATVINGLALQDALESLGCETRLTSSLKMDGVAEPFIRRRVKRHLEKGRIVILAGGTGAPFVTTDTAAAQKALELGADILMKATRVDGVYNADPEKDPEAVLFDQLTYRQVHDKNLRVMDQTAITQCQEHNLPILVFNYRTDGNIERAVRGEKIGTLVSSKTNS